MTYSFEDPHRVGATDSHPLPLPLNDSRFLALPRHEQRRAANRMPQPMPRPSSTPHTYLIKAEGSPLVKIGFASNPKKRLASLQTGQPMTLSLLWSTPGNYEDALHEAFADRRVRGEWFDLEAIGDPVAVVQAVVAGLEATSA